MMITYVILALAIPVIVSIVGVCFTPALARPVDSPHASRANDSAARRARNRRAIDTGAFTEVEFGTELRGYPTVEVDQWLAAAATGEPSCVGLSWQPVRGGYRMDEVDDLVGYLCGEADDENPAPNPLVEADQANDSGDAPSDKPTGKVYPHRQGPGAELVADIDHDSVASSAPQSPR